MDHSQHLFIFLILHAPHVIGYFNRMITDLTAKHITLTIADIPVSFTLPALFAHRLKKTLIPFIVAGKKPQARITIEILTKRDKAGKRPIVSDLKNTLQIRRGDMAFAFDFRKMRGNLRIVPDRFVFNAFLRLFYSTLLPRKQGFLLHASAAVMKGRACAFAGVSGSGKTTMARLLPARVMLSDELVALRKKQDRFYLFGTPFWGEFKGKGNASPYPLTNLFFLKKGPAMSVRSLDGKEGLPRILRCVLYLGRNRETVLRIIGITEALFTIPAVKELTFARERKKIRTWFVKSGAAG